MTGLSILDSILCIFVIVYGPVLYMLNCLLIGRAKNDLFFFCTQHVWFMLHIVKRKKIQTKTSVLYDFNWNSDLKGWYWYIQKFLFFSFFFWLTTMFCESDDTGWLLIFWKSFLSFLFCLQCSVSDLFILYEFNDTFFILLMINWLPVPVLDYSRIFFTIWTVQ